MKNNEPYSRSSKMGRDWKFVAEILCTWVLLLGMALPVYAQSEVSSEEEHSLLGITPPEYPGGEEKLLDFLKKNARFPKILLKNKVQGKVKVSFVVGKQGFVRVLKAKAYEWHVNTQGNPDNLLGRMRSGEKRQQKLIEKCKKAMEVEVCVLSAVWENGFPERRMAGL